MNLILYSVYPHNPQCICCGLICEKRDCLTSFALLVADNPQSLLGTRWSKHGNRWTMKPVQPVWLGRLQKDYISVHVDHKTSMNGSGPVCRRKWKFIFPGTLLFCLCQTFVWSLPEETPVCMSWETEWNAVSLRQLLVEEYCFVLFGQLVGWLKHMAVGRKARKTSPPPSATNPKASPAWLMACHVSTGNHSWPKRGSSSLQRPMGLICCWHSTRSFLIETKLRP